MKVVLTEKPSVARDIASHLAARSRREGFFEGNGYQVTWALGHLVTLKEPDDYDPALKKWSLERLPFVPDRFELKLIDDKRCRQQFAVIKKLFRDATELICATDAGREGELIFRYILELTRCRSKPIQRLWLSSLTPEAIRNAFGNLRPSADYDNLYFAAKCRSEADWIVGLNATRNLTVRFGGRGILWTAGRVQTPVLAMIVGRDDEIRAFRPQSFWELLTRYRDTEFRFAGGRFWKEEDAQHLLQQVTGFDFYIHKVETKPEKSLPPQLYDLTDLQRDMNRRFAIPAAETLRAAQSLYESKLITYPRTDSRYLGSDMKREVPGILRKLAAIRPTEIGRLNLQALRFDHRIINDKKISDHHAIIPTGTPPGNLSPRQQQVFDAVVTRMIAAFYPPCLKEVTRVEGQANNVPFVAKGTRVTSPGWTELYPRKVVDQGKGDKQPLPEFRVGQHGPHEPSVRHGETQPPQHFTENSLLGALETAGKLVDEEQLKDALKEKGLGTPATRAPIIETLLKRNYIQRAQKTLTATDQGRYLVALVQQRDLKSPELTGEWEARLKKIETGHADPEQFMTGIVDYARDIIRTSDVSQIDESTLGPCPSCGRPVIQGKRGFGCSGWRDGCRFVLWRTYKDHELHINQIRRILQHRILLPPLQLVCNERGEQRRVVLYLSDSGQLMEVPEPESQERRPRPKARGGRKQTSRSTARTREPAAKRNTAGLGSCPICGAEVVEQQKSYSCSQWKQGCKFVIWKTMASKRIGRRTAQMLLRSKRTSVLKGFRSKQGKTFDARLKLEDGQVRFDFPSSA